MNKYKYFFSSILLFSLLCCQYAPYAHKYTTKKPQEIDLTGTYIFDFQTVDTVNTNLMSQLKDKILLPKIQIKNDGTYFVRDLPVFEFHLPTNFKSLVTESGKWKVTTVGTIDSGNENTEVHYGIELIGLPFEVKNVGLMNNKSPYDLIFSFGDPDQGHVMVFKKK